MQALRIQTRSLIEQKNPHSVMSQVKEFNKDKGFGLQKVVDTRRLSSQPRGSPEPKVSEVGDNIAAADIAMNEADEGPAEAPKDT